MTTYKTGSKIGDIVWSLPFVCENGGADIMYLYPNGEFTQANYEYVKPLLEAQPYIKEVKLWNNESFDINLDEFVQHAHRGTNLVECFFTVFNKQFDRGHIHTHPHLFVETIELPKNRSILISRGAMMHKNGFRDDFNPHIKGFFDRGLNEVGFFVGHPQEHEDFCKTYNCNIPHVVVEDALHTARLINSSKMVITNQTSTSAIAEILKVSLFLEAKINGPDVFDCQFNRPNLWYI